MKKKIRITADAILLEGLIQELEEAAETVYPDRSDKQLTGAEVMSIIADLTSIGISIFTAWQARNKVFNNKIDIQEIEPESAVEGDIKDDSNRQSE